MHITTAVLALVTLTGAASAQAVSRDAGPPAPGDSVRLTRAAAIAEALARNPQLEVARQQTAEARANRTQISAFPDLTVTASLDQEPGFLRLGSAGARNVNVGLDVPFPDKFRLHRNIGTAGVHAAQYSYLQLRQLIAAQTSEQYDSVLVALRHRSDLLESRSLAADFLKKTQARFAGGTAARLDVIRAQVDVAQAENDLIANQRAIQTAQAGLNRLLGRPLGLSIIPADSLVVPPPLPPLEVIEAYALQGRPELGVIQSQIAGAQASTTLAREFWLPDLTLSAGRDYAQTTPYMYSAGLAFPIPLFFWQHTRGEIAGNVARVRELTAAQADLRAQIGQDVRTAYANASIALRQVVFLRDQLLPSATDALRAALASYGLGGSSALEVIDARRTLVSAQSQYADALAAANTARADLQRAAATPLDTLGPGTAP